MIEVLPATLIDQSSVDLSVSPDTARRIRDAVPASTRRAYAHDRAQYDAWCSATGRVAVPATAQTFAEYVSHLAGLDRAPKSIERALGAIRTQHRASGFEPPDRTAALLVLREHRKARARVGIQQRKATPLLLDGLRSLVETCDPATPAGIRNRALIVLGFAMMARRSELVGLDIDDLGDVDDGMNVLIQWSKTDQDAVGHVLTVLSGSFPQSCPVRLVRAWRELLASRGQESGPLFRPIDRHGRIFGEPKAAGASRTGRMSGYSVSIILRSAARQAGVSTEALSAHSLRSGAATEAYRAGAGALSIARHGRWKDGSPVPLGYIRTVDKWRENPMTGIGL